MDRHTEGQRPGGQRQTHRHTLGEQGRAWPGPAASVLPQRHLPPGQAQAPTPRRGGFWLICQTPSPTEQGREQQSRGREGPLQPPAPPTCPSPRKLLQELNLAQQPEERVPGCRVESEPGLQGSGSGRSVAQWAPSGGGLRGGSQVKRPGAGQSCSFPSAGIPKASSCPRSQGTGTGGGFSPKPGPPAAGLL